MKAFFFFMLAIFTSFSNSLAFDYFDANIDYWNKEHKDVSKKTVPKKSSSQSKTSRNDFDWDKYLDPKNDEFFQEGNHTPPAPLMELARNPTDENIKKWFKLIEMKNKLTSRLQKKLQEHVAQNKKGLKAQEIELISEATQNLPQNHVDFRRFKFRMYFESSCPHCKRMMGTMEELRDQGFYIELVQIDSNTKARKGLSFPITQATKIELIEKKINAWPVLFIADLKKNLVYRLNGYQSTPQVLSILSSK